MKRPKSPDWLDSSPPPKEEEEEEDGEEKKVVGGRRAKRERRQSGSSGATVCQVCSKQLNSSTQAQIHYRGKTHQRRLRRLAKAVSSGGGSPNASGGGSPNASGAQGHPLPGSRSLPGRPLQPQTHATLEHFLPLNLFPNFNAMDAVQKALMKHTFEVTPPKKKPIISCNICHLRFNSTTQAEAHYKGHKHARKIKALETQRSRQKKGHGERERGDTKEATSPSDSHLKERTGPSSSSRPAQQPPEDVQSCSPHPLLSDPPSDGSRLGTSSAPRSDPQRSSTGGEEEEEEEELVKVEEEEELVKVEEANNNLHCPTCKVTVNSSSQLESHCSGSKHKLMLHGQNGSQLQSKVMMTSSPRPAHRVKQPMDSESRAAVGVSSRPFHCKMCQVSVNSETQLKQHMNSRRHKERLAWRPVKKKFTPYNKLQPCAIWATKLALPAGFLNPAMASGPIRLAPGPTAIIQGPLINPTLFRPAPGPLRASHAPIIFSPY